MPLLRQACSEPSTLTWVRKDLKSPAHAHSPSLVGMTSVHGTAGAHRTSQDIRNTYTILNHPVYMELPQVHRTPWHMEGHWIPPKLCFSCENGLFLCLLCAPSSKCGLSPLWEEV